MTDKKIKFNARLILISLCVVLLLSAMCGCAAAEKSVYVPVYPPGGDPSADVCPWLSNALEGDGEVIILSGNVNIDRDIYITGNKILTTCDPQGYSVDVGNYIINVNEGDSLTIGSTDNNKLYIMGAAGRYLFDVKGRVGNYSSLVMLNSAELIHNYPQHSLINVENGTFTMDGGKISNNYGLSITSGVNVGNNGQFIMNNGNISDNRGFFGVGVHVRDNGKFTMKSGKITYNTGGDDSYGGGVYVGDSGVFVQEGGEISHNSAYYGGGVYVAASDIDTAEYTMNGGSLKYNTAEYNGGGVYAATNYSSPNVKLTGGEITDNHANKKGGGVFLSQFGGTNYSQRYGQKYYEGAVFTMDGGDIKNNTADTAGGVYVGGNQIKTTDLKYIFVPTVFNMNGGNIINNTNSAVYVSAGKFVMTGGAITENNYLPSPVFVNDSKNYKPDLSVKHQGVFEMKGGYIYDNLGNRSYVNNNGGFVNMSGGGIYYTGVNNTSTGILNNGNLTMSGNGFISGFKNHGVVSNNFFEMSGGTIMNNWAEDGGGVYNTGYLLLRDKGDVYNNTANVTGGGIYSNKSFNITGGSVESNKAKIGGGVYCAGDVIISGGEILSNKANDYGGGIFTNKSIKMSGGSISKNYANYSGAVLFKNLFNMTGGSISQNKAKSGGAIYMADKNASSVLNLSGGEIVSNSADDGSGIYFTSGAFNLADSGYVNEYTNVLMGAKQRIKVVSNLTRGVYSIVPATGGQQTVVEINVPNQNASNFMGNFNLGSGYSKTAYYNNLVASEMTIVTTHVDAPYIPPSPPDTQYTGNIYCSVTFDPMNGSNATTIPLVFGSLAPKPEDPVNGFADFLGWFTVFDYEWNFENDTVESPVILYAHWEGLPSPISPVAVENPAVKIGGISPIIFIIAGVVVVAAAVAATIIVIRRRDSEE